MTATFTKLPDGTWGIYVSGGTPEVGAVVTVTKRSGDTSLARVTEVIDGARCRFEDVSEVDPPAAGNRKRLGFAPTGEKLVALELFREGHSLAIEAGAGTGKTTALVFFAEDADDRGLRGQYIAFNKAIVRDSAAKFPASVSCDTAHSLAYRAIAAGTPFEARMRSGARMKSWEIAAILGIGETRVTTYDGRSKSLSGSFLAGLVMKGVDRFCQTADERISARHLPTVDGLDPPPDPTAPRSYAVNNALAASLEPVLRRAWADLIMFEGRLPFTLSRAMAVFLKLWQLNEPRIGADYIMFDEAQDASPVMVDVISKQTHAQLVWVGDSNQQIYAFTGAINALASVPRDAEAMLTQSFRFGPAVADTANLVLAKLPTRMRLIGTEDIPSRVAPVLDPRAILTRTNATAIRHVMAAIENDRRPFLVGGGGEVAAFCRAARDLMADPPRRTDHPELGCFENWAEVIEYVANDEQGDDLRLMVTLIEEFGVDTILDAVNGCAKEADADVVVSTAHKAKGREFESVLVASDFPAADKMGDEEHRLLYVAVTRATHDLDVTGVDFFHPGGDR